jgi:hypothetical protein
MYLRLGTEFGKPILIKNYDAIFKNYEARRISNKDP